MAVRARLLQDATLRKDRLDANGDRQHLDNPGFIKNLFTRDWDPRVSEPFHGFVPFKFVLFKSLIPYSIKCLQRPIKDSRESLI